MLFLVGALTVVTAFLAAVASQLRKRVVSLEERSKTIDGLLKPAHAEQTAGSALSVLDRIDSRLTAYTPALRRVLEFSIAIDLPHFCEATGITIEELKGLEPQFRFQGDVPVVFWPADSMVIEEWATHTEVWSHSGRRVATFYPTNSLIGKRCPPVLWHHPLPQREGEGGSHPPSLQVVIHGESVKFWVLGGRFRYVNVCEARQENILVEIPLQENKLGDYLWKHNATEWDHRRPTPYTWLRQYGSGNLEEPNFIKWELCITDFVARAADPSPA